MSVATPPVLGSPERPSDGVDTSTVTATCTYCKSPIYSGEGVYHGGPEHIKHWACHEQVRKDFDNIPNLLAGIRKGLDKLTK